MKGLMALIVASAAVAGCASAAGESAKPSDPAPAEVAAAADPWAGTGFSVWELDGRWWVFREDSKELKEFRKGGEPVKSVTRVGAGPAKQTLRAVDAETLDAFAAWRPGFSVRAKEGRIWIFRENSKELAEYDRLGELVKSVTRVGAGPNRTTLRAADVETLDAWAAAK